MKDDLKNKMKQTVDQARLKRIFNKPVLAPDLRSVAEGLQGFGPEID